MSFILKLRLVQQRFGFYKKKKDTDEPIIRCKGSTLSNCLFCFVFPFPSRDIFSWNVNMHKSFSWKRQASDSQTATSIEIISQNQVKNKIYQHTHGLQIFQ